MFSIALIKELPEGDKQLATLAFCNPVFMHIAQKHIDHFTRELTSLNVEDEDFKLTYKVAKEQLGAWRSLLQFAAEYAPEGTEWGNKFEALLTQNGGFAS